VKTNTNRAELPSPVAVAPKPEKSPVVESPRIGRRPGRAGKNSAKQTQVAAPVEEVAQDYLVPEFPHVPRPPVVFECQPTDMPSFLCQAQLKASIFIIFLL